jgi:hypothetical protein
MFFRKVLRSNKYCGFKIEVFSRSVVFFFGSIGERGLTLFSLKLRKEKNCGICYPGIGILWF